MICQTIRIRIRNAREISQPARKAKLKLKELDNCQIGDQWVSDQVMFVQFADEPTYCVARLSVVSTVLNFKKWIAK